MILLVYWWYDISVTRTPLLVPTDSGNARALKYVERQSSAFFNVRYLMIFETVFLSYPSPMRSTINYLILTKTQNSCNHLI
jgi:hypothetical protein